MLRAVQDRSLPPDHEAFVDAEPPTGRVVGMPTRDDVSLPVNENLVVEFCSR